MKKIATVKMLTSLILAFSASMVVGQDKGLDTPSEYPAVPSTPEDPLLLGGSSGITFNGIAPSRAQGTLGVADPSYRRQLDLCSGLSAVGTEVPYETFAITNTTVFDATFSAFTSDLNAPGSCAIDSFLSSYSPWFGPTNSNVNCVTSNNNSGGTLCSEIDFVLAPGQTSVVVASSHANDAFFSYQLNFEATIEVINQYPTVVGDLSFEDATYNRQAGDCGGLSGIGTAVSYETLSLSNGHSETMAFVVETSDPGDFEACSIDTHLSAYVPSFDPNNPLANCFTSNDDGGPGVCSRMTFDLAPEQSVTIVVASFGNGATFPYQVRATVPIVFTDGFELGNMGAWSAFQP